MDHLPNAARPRQCQGTHMFKIIGGVVVYGFALVGLATVINNVNFERY